MKHNNKNGMSYYLCVNNSNQSVTLIWAIVDHFYVYPEEYNIFDTVIEISKKHFRLIKGVNNETITKVANTRAS